MYLQKTLGQPTKLAQYYIPYSPTALKAVQWLKSSLILWNAMAVIMLCTKQIMPGRHRNRSVRHNEIFAKKLTQIILTYDSYGVPYYI